MKKIFVLAMVIALILTACGQVKTNIPNTKDAKAAQAIIENWISANKANDVDKLMSLYADNIVWMDYGLNDGPFNKADLDVMNRMSTGEIKSKLESYLLTPDGRFAVAQLNLSMKATSTGKWVSTPAVAVLEFKDGKIVNETWYYDGELYR